MMPVNRMVDETPVTAAGLDPESAWWLGVLAETGPRREAALARLHELLVRVARAEVARRGPRVRITGPELDDLACQAAADALMAVTGKLGQFRGESRFTTWACKFAIFEVSAKIGRHFWRHPAVPLDAGTGTGCRTGSVSTPRRRPSGGTWLRRCAAPWMTS